MASSSGSANKTESRKSSKSESGKSETRRSLDKPVKNESRKSVDKPVPRKPVKKEDSDSDFEVEINKPRKSLSQDELPQKKITKAPTKTQGIFFFLALTSEF